MTLNETRQLGIEFERRVQTMIPEKEFLNKLDTLTIYSFLNQYQDKYIHDIYRSLDLIPSGSKLSAHVEAVLQSMLTTAEESVNNTDSRRVLGNGLPINLVDSNNVIIGTGRSVTIKLPDNFYMYLRSISLVSSTFAFKRANNATTAPINVLPNQLVSQSDVWKLIETPHNSLRILRYPAAVLSEYKEFDEGGESTVKHPTLTVIHDQYTTIEKIQVLYYKQPAHFDVMTSTACELPMDAFDDIVTGAVDLYVQYVSGAVANKQRQDNERRQRENNNRNNKESEE